MNETLLSFFFKLIQLGIGTRESLQLEAPLPESTWKELLTLARKQAVTGIVMDGILKLPAEYLPPTPIKLKGIQQLLRIEQLNRRLNGEAVQVSEFLQAEGYACTILKGRMCSGNMAIPDFRIRNGRYTTPICSCWTKQRWNCTSSPRTCITR